MLSGRQFSVVGIVCTLAMSAAGLVSGQSASPTPIAPTSWTLRYVDSEEAPRNAARLAFDGNPATFWHTQWVNAAPRPPHEIQIDLGQTYDVAGFRYLPRQDGSANGAIAQYEFYVSSSTTSWGAPVVAGALRRSVSPQDVLFPQKRGRFVRLRALSEVNGLAFSSMAELSVLTPAAIVAPPASGDVDYGGYRPHYQGYGVSTPGGRGGAVLRVTHLGDTFDRSSPLWNGSFRKAVTASGPRFVIFEVSGTIVLAGNIEITSPFITVAGQTAPSPGIVLRGAHLQIDTHDVVLQHLRVRVGNVGNTPQGIWIRSDANNIVIDHASVSWAVHNSITAFAPPSPAPGVGDITIIDSVVSEALGCSGVHQLYPCDPTSPVAGQFPHSRAFLFGDDNRSATYNGGVIRVAMIRTVSANNNDRHPAIQGGVHAVLVNNLIYNPSQTPWTGIHFSDAYRRGPTLATVLGNVLIPGPTTPGSNGYGPKYFREEGDAYLLRVDSSVDPRTRIYLDDNYYAKHCGGTACLASSTAQWMLARDLAAPGGNNVRSSTPPLVLVNLPRSTVLPWAQVEAFVTANAGARPLDRDAVDTRIFRELTLRTGGVPNKTSERAGTGTAADGFPILAEHHRLLAVPANPHTVVDGVGRTAIEAWLESYARALEPASQGR